MPDNGLDIYPNKSKSCITQRKKDFKNVSDCNKDEYNSNFKRLISKCDFKCKKSMSESDLNFKGSFSEHKSYKLDISEGSPGQ